MIIAAGELLVEFVSHENDCGLGKLTEYSGPYPSGAPAIFIDQAARMGARTRIYGGVGNDAFGQALVERLNSHGVDTSWIHTQNDHTTGTAFVSYYADGSRTFIFHLGGTAADRIGQCPLEGDEKDVILHISGSSLGNPVLRGRLVDLAHRVIAAGGKLSCDPNVRPELMKDSGAREALQEIIADSAFLLPSEDDMTHLYPDQEHDDAMEKMLANGAEIVALKRGDKGSVILDNSGRTELAPHPVESIDPTGAGDCFCGTFLAMLEHGLTPVEAGRFANCAGALAVTRRGPMEGNSSRAVIEQHLGSPIAAEVHNSSNVT